MKIKIAPSILSADFARLGEEVDAVLKAGADEIHFDVMDNHYVPNLTFGPMICKALRNYGITAPIDIHLMVKPVDKLIMDFINAGASSISFHPEASEHIDRSLDLIKQHNCKAGLVFNPATCLSHMNYVMDKLDFILIMSVNPGFGGQKFIPSCIQKIEHAKQIIQNHNKQNNINIAIDGGINKETIRLAYDAGADTFIAGSAIFNQDDYARAIGELKKALD